MAQVQASQILSEISRVLPKKTILTLAREGGVVKRQRRVDVVALIYSLVLGVGLGRKRSVEGLRRVYQRLTGQVLARSSFLQRFTHPLAELLSKLVQQAVAETARHSRRLGGSFSAFVAVLGIDSSVIRVSDEMAQEWPAAWTNHTKAAVKLTAVINVSGRGLHRVQLSPGSRHDTHLLVPGRWMKGKLLLFDLGFFKTELFQRIDDCSGYFLSRLRKQSNPKLLRSHRRADRHLAGSLLKDAQKGHEADVLDFDATLTYQRRLKHRKASVQFRVIAIYNVDDKKWHRYVTNAPPSMLAARFATAVYAARWEIELLFRELKSVYRVEEIPSKNPAANLCFIFVSLLALIMSRRVHRLLERCAPHESRALPHDRWAKIFSAVAIELLHACFALRGRRKRAQVLWDYLLAEAPDPNRSRCLLVARAQKGVVAFA